MSNQKLSMVVVGGVVALIGGSFLLVSHAATPALSVEPENGTLSSGATVGSASSASGGKYVQFGASPTPPPTQPSSGSTTDNTCSSSASTPTAPVSGYSLSMCDDFNGSSSSHFGGYDGGGDGTVVGAGRISSQCTFSNGQLVETQDSNGATCGGSTDFSGMYGLWEVRMRAYSTGTSGSAPHPVLILWPDSDVWNDGELDFFETDIGSPAGGYLHCVGANISNNCYTIPDNPVDYSQYHIYSFQWQPGRMTGYIDGKQWWTSTDGSFMPSKSMHLTIQLDNLSGRTPVKSGVMAVDWVHMYK